MGAPRRRLPLSLILILLAGWAMKRCASPSCCAQPRAMGNGHFAPRHLVVLSPARWASSCASQCVLRCGCHPRVARVLSVAARACPSRGAEHNKMARHVRVARHLRGALRGWQPQRNTHTSAGGNRGEWWAGCPTDVTRWSAPLSRDSCSVDRGRTRAAGGMRRTRQVGGCRQSGVSPTCRCVCLPRALGWEGSWSLGARAGVCRHVPPGIHINQRIRRPVACSRAATYLGMAQLCMLL